MKKYIRLSIETEDKIGVTLKILGKIYSRHISLNSVEVFSKRVNIQIEDIKSQEIQDITNDLMQLEDVISIKEIKLLEFEKSSKRLEAIIDSVDEGVIALNPKLEIEFFNDYSEKIFDYDKTELLGKNIKSFLGKSTNLIGFLEQGKNYDNIETFIQNERVEGRYLASGRAIKDDDGYSAGAVLTIKDYKKAKELADIVISSEDDQFKDIIGNSNAIYNLKKIAKAVAKSDSTILIRGESGTGKELFARAIKNLSQRENQRFITINCAAIPDSLIESELFGYEKGSFTGALNSGKLGLFKEADKGTLFLDEIGELSLATQAKLLRVLQEGVVRRIGSSKEEKVDVRIICATHRNLEEMIEKGMFREDLYYRLNVIPLEIPPLRDRKEDIPLLVSYFVQKMNKKLNKSVGSTSMVFLERLMSYEYTGNIRELENIMERAMNLCEGAILSEEHLMLNPAKEKDNEKAFEIKRSEASLKKQLEDIEKQMKLFQKEKEKSEQFKQIASINEEQYSAFERSLIHVVEQQNEKNNKLNLKWGIIFCVLSAILGNLLPPISRVFSSIFS